MAGRVIHTAQIVMDLTIRIDSLPEPGADVFGEDTGMHVGGGFNVLYAARQLGTPAVYAGTLGNGAFADAAREGLAAIGVNHIGATVAGELGYCVAITDASAERTFISTRGAETRDPLNAFDALELSDDDVLYICGYSLAHDANRAALERLAGRLDAPRFRTLFDVSPMIGDISLETLKRIGSLKPLWSLNKREANIFAERLGIANGTPEQLAERLADRLGEVLVRVGAEGAWYAVGDRRQAGVTVRHIPTLSVRSVDTNGAGDTHSGVLCAALARGEEIMTALLWANVAGGLSTTRSGPATCPSESEIREKVRSVQGLRTQI